VSGPDLMRSGDRRRSVARWRASQVFSRNGELAHEGVQRRPRHTEASRSLANDSASLSEHADHMFPFDVLQPCCPRRVATHWTVIPTKGRADGGLSKE